MTPAEAVAIQQRLAPLVERQSVAMPVRLIAGTDISLRGGDDGEGLAAVVVLSWPELVPVEQSVVRAVVRFPYVPGLLSFREIPLLLPAFERLRSRPDLLVVDGQGIAHPRRLGLASHLGLLFDVPAMGCAKSRLTGRIEGELGAARGAAAALLDRGELVGHAVRTRTGTNPVYVSTGHRVDAAAAVRWALDLAVRYRLPEPTRLAHQAAAGKVVAPSA